MPLAQETRLLAIKTALGPNALAIRTLRAEEQISRMFQIEVELSSEDGEIKFDELVGQEATVRLDVGQKQKRYFHGFVSRMVQFANEGSYAQYQAILVPWLWFLTRTSDCRIYQNMTVPDILREVFSKHGGTAKWNLTGHYEPKEYCVQYRETDFNFVSRLMEQEGIYYYFQHEDGSHTMMVVDSISAHEPTSGYEEVVFHELERGATMREVITDWTTGRELQPVAYALTDFDFKKPRTNLLALTRLTRQHARASYEMFDFPGEYLEHGDGDRLANVRLNEIQSQFESHFGNASARGLAAGSTFKLSNHPRTDQNDEYLITRVNMQVNAGQYASNGDGAEFFSCTFSAIQKAQQFRPARLTPKPIVQGPQTAIVVGPGGDEIFTDKYGRVKVHFPWDRYDKSDENSSCWIRVSQFWAGKEWGSIHIPRIGQEVIVEFLEGDPDRPIITGRVYNAEQMPPYGLPGNKTQSGWKSRSSKGGGSANFNEIRFEDKKGSEEVYIHAEKDQNNVVEHDETTYVGHDRTEKVEHDETIKIGKDRREEVGHDESIKIGNDEVINIGRNKDVQVGGNHGEGVAGSMTINVGLTLTEVVAINYSETVGGAMELTVGGVLAESVGLNRSETVGRNSSETVGSDKTVDVGKNLKQKVGKNSEVEIGGDLQEKVKGKHNEAVEKEYILQAKKIQLQAEDEVSIKTGDAEITMKKNGDISIKGNKINIKGSGDVTIKGSKISEN